MAQENPQRPLHGCSRYALGAVAAQDFGAVRAPGGGGAVGVHGDGPAPAVDRDLVVEGAVQAAVPDAGLAAVGLVGEMFDLAGGGGLAAAAEIVMIVTDQ